MLRQCNINGVHFSRMPDLSRATGAAGCCCCGSSHRTQPAVAERIVHVQLVQHDRGLQEAVGHVSDLLRLRLLVAPGQRRGVRCATGARSGDRCCRRSASHQLGTTDFSLMVEPRIAQGRLESRACSPWHGPACAHRRTLARGTAGHARDDAVMPGARLSYPPGRRWIEGWEGCRSGQGQPAGARCGGRPAAWSGRVWSCDGSDVASPRALIPCAARTRPWPPPPARLQRPSSHPCRACRRPLPSPRRTT